MQNSVSSMMIRGKASCEGRKIAVMQYKIRDAVESLGYIHEKMQFTRRKKFRYTILILFSLLEISLKSSIVALSGFSPSSIKAEGGDTKFPIKAASCTISKLMQGCSPSSFSFFFPAVVLVKLIVIYIENTGPLVYGY